MAPVGVHVAGLVAASPFTPELLIASQVLLFILLITLLIICTQCGRHSFQLEESSEKERKSSTLIRVVKLEEAAESRENPVINDIVKDEEVPSPTSENGSVQTPLEITPWRRHTGVLNHQGQTGDTPTTDVTPVITDPVSGDTTPPVTDPPFVLPTFAPVVTPLMEQEVALQSAPPTVSSHPPEAETGGADSPVQSQEVPVGNIPENPDGFWQQGPAHHTYESLEEVREAVSDLRVSPQEEEKKKVEPDYQTWQELDYSLLPPPPLFDPQHEAEPEFPVPPTSGEGEGEDPQGMGFNAMYAQVSKKYKVPPPPSQPPPDNEEEVPPPPSQPPPDDEEEVPPPPFQPPPDDEEEDPAPPIPERASELEENPSTVQ
ncbi:extensin [Megalops cyprinoides]|uniref:extensin n=1 Tax=Megalops cyprinoides TaxID=118141 RepID=UPI001864EA59|nr:extensin [Megalops cyprinoides]